MRSKKVIINYLYNTAYQVITLIVPLVTTPYVSRVLGVTNIGIHQYTQSIARYFILIGAVGTSLYGQREIAYLQDKPKERSIAFWEIEVFRFINTVICVVIFYCVFCRYGLYSLIFLAQMPEVLATAFDISWLYMGMESFRWTVVVNAIAKLSGMICIFSFVKGQGDLWIYTLCLTAPVIVGNIFLWIPIKRYIVKTGLTVHALIRGIRDRLKPIIMLFLPQVAMDVYLLLDKTMIGLFGSSIDQVGYYSQAQKIITVILVVVTSIGTVMLPAMSACFARGDHDEIQRSVRTAFKFVYMLSFAFMFGLCAVAPRLIPLFFGPGYEPVIPLMMIISPIFVIISTSTILGRQYLLPTNQQKAFTMSILAGACTNFVLNTILIHFWDAIGASIATVLAELAVTVVQCMYVRRQLPLKQCLMSGVRYGVFGIIMYIAVRVFGSVLPQGKTWPLIAMVLFGMMIYAGELLFTKDSMVILGLSLLKDRAKT